MEPQKNNSIKRRVLFWRRCLLLCTCLFGYILANAQEDVYNVIMERIAADLLASVNDPQLAVSAAAGMKSMLPAGYWADVNYDNPEFEHLARIKGFAEAYSWKGNRLYRDEKLYTAITTALQYWLDKQPRNRNWWFNEISFPQQIGQILILMRMAPNPLPRDMEALLIQRMTRKLKPHDFANTSDEALHYLYRACLTKDKLTMDSAVTYLFEPVHVEKDGEGLQPDNSYFQHGRQQAIASYGVVFVTNSYNAAWYLSGTPYAMPAGQLNLLSSFFRNTFLQSVRGTYFDFNTRGRGISRHDSMKAGLGPLLRKVLLTDPAGGLAWQTAAARAAGKPASYGIEPAHTNYWVSGYTLHTRPGYSFSVQLNSTRTLRTERGNNENILGKFLPDGATDIRRKGGEYSSIMPVWEWDKLPGVTNREYGSDSGCTIKKEWGIPGTTGFSGGISDSLYGATAYDLDYDSVKAHKSWFFFDREVVCLGAGIGSRTPEDITTTIDQCWQKGEVRASGKDGKIVRLKGDKAYNDLQWVWQDSIGYFFPAAGDGQERLHVRSRTQTGDWYHINHGQSKKEVSGEVFTLWMNHGAAPSNASYAYIVVPGVDDATEMAAYDTKSIHIIQNTADLQAVEQKGLDILQIVYFTGGTLSDGAITITADQPCLVLIRNVHGSHPEVYVSDPTQKLRVLRLSLKLPGVGPIRPVECDLPQAPYAGSTIKLNIEK